ncbi:MAG: undecaprenyl-diphosphate phosphatase [Patescibacteria group bacterium]|jgi:undecaprenyl-diphosphatase
MNFLQATILGVVQGITEWLPISSDGHLVLFEKLMRLSVPVSFDIFLHVGSLLVIIVFFRQAVSELLKSFFHRPNTWPEDRKKWWIYLIISTLVTGIVGLLIYPHIENYRTISFASTGLLITSAFVLASRFAKDGKSFNYWVAILLGLVQGLAVLPGISRSGLVLSLALLLGLNKKQAFDYTFILAIPAIAASFILAVKDFAWQSIYLWGLLVTIMVGFASLALLKKIVNQDKFYWFFIYTLILGIILKI